MPYRNHYPCSVQDCTRPVLAKQLCALHYERWKRLGSTDLPVRNRIVRICSIDGCERRASARGWCSVHYYRWQRCGNPTGTLPKEDPALRFWSFVNKNGPIHPICGQCWIWTRSTNRGGYGVFVPRKGGDIVAHRYSWELAHGGIPAGLRVLHRCDTPACVNPAHLLLGTQADNVADMISKSRSRQPRGERNAKAKLTTEAVKEIRRRYQRGHRFRPSATTAKKLAEEYGVGLTAIYAIVNNETWTHIPPG